MRNRRRERELTAQIVTEAKRHVGYRAQPQRKSAFQLKGYAGQPWNGTFIDRVLHDAFGDFAEVRFLSTVTALSYYVKRNRVYQKPRVGDIVFYNFATDPLQPFEQPHVGVVVSVHPDGSIRTVEGEASPGVPQGSQLADGVFNRHRFAPEWIGFVRPQPLKPYAGPGTKETVRISHFTSNPKTRAKATTALQRALNRALGLTFNRGKYDAETRTALGLYARESGWVANRGEIEYPVLDTLSTRTGEFELDE